MKVYSYYYGASAERGIGIQAQSRELENLPLGAVMRELSSLHALDSSEHSGEMLSYFICQEGYSILGLSYPEPPKKSGYNRMAPCGLQYITREDSLAEVAVKWGTIINFVNFRKPASTSPEPLQGFPLNESGYSYHNSAAILACLVDELVKTALSPGENKVLVVALPKGRNSDYAAARYTIAEALWYLPASLRTKIRFFTGLPVADGISDPKAGYENALKYGANVVFCPNEYAKRIGAYASSMVDMEHPAGSVGAFAKYISNAPDISDGLTMVESLLQGNMTYEALNKAAVRVMHGETVTMEQLREELRWSENERKELEQANAKGAAEYERLNAQYRELERQMQDTRSWGSRSVVDNKDEEDRKPGLLRKILLVAAVIVLMGITAVVTVFICKSTGGNGKEQPPTTTMASTETDEPESSEEPESTVENESGITETPTDAQTESAAAQNGDTVMESDAEVPGSSVTESTGTETENSETGTAGAPESEEPGKPTETPRESESPEPAVVHEENVNTMPTTESAVEEQIGEETTEGEGSSAEQDETGTEAIPKTNEEATLFNDQLILKDYIGSVERYGKTNATSVNLREKPDRESSSLKMIKKNTVVWMISNEENEKKEVWTKVYTLDQETGYIKTDYLEPLSSEENDEYLREYKTPELEEKVEQAEDI